MIEKTNPVSKNDYTTPGDDCQVVWREVLEDYSRTGKRRPWETQKAAAERLAARYRAIDEDKADRLDDCASWLKFYRTEGGGLKLALANFCRVRLCPMCQWRRALKIAGQMQRICEALPDDYNIIALNLTIRNCEPSQIGRTLDTLLDGFGRLVKYAEVAKILHGYYRATEITINRTCDSEWYGTLHPHLHTLLVVRKSYWHSCNYISAARWCELWRKACKLDYSPDICVYRLRIDPGQTITDALAEVTKYTVKASDLCDDDIPDSTIASLDSALTKRRFFGLGGIFKDLHKQLNLSDPDEDTADLIHTDGDDIEEDKQEQVYYIWRSGIYIEWEGEVS